MSNSSERRFPLNAKDYELYEDIGDGVSRAQCTVLAEIVAVKILDLEKCRIDVETIRNKVHRIDHPNQLRPHCSFSDGNNFWIVMPYLHGQEHIYQDVKIVLPDKLENDEASTSGIRASPVNPLSSSAAQDLPKSQNLLLDNEIQRGLSGPCDPTAGNINSIVNTEGEQIPMEIDISCEVHFPDQRMKKLGEEVKNQTKANAQEPLLNVTENAENNADPMVGVTSDASQLNKKVSPAPLSQCMLERLEIFGNDVVANKRSLGIGVVSKDRSTVFHIDDYKTEGFQEEELVLLSRSFEHSDKVTSLTAEKEHIGVIISVENKVDLASSSTGVNKIIHRKIDTDDLERMRSLDVGDLVIHGSWLGKVEDLELSIMVRFENRRVGTYSLPDPNDDILPIFTNAVEEKAIEKPYYRGQALWYSGCPGTMKGNVKQLNVRSVTVKWIGTCVAGAEEPPRVLRASQVKRLTTALRRKDKWTLGKRCRLDGEDFLIVDIRTYVTVKWQDGRVERLDSRQVAPRKCPVGTVFGGFFVQKRSETNLNVIGFVKWVEDAEAMVQWVIDGERQNQRVRFQELEVDVDRSFNYGTVVYLKNATQPLFGIVINLSEGLVHVGWQDGSETRSAPEDIERFFLPQDDDDAADDHQNQDDTASDEDYSYEDDSSESDPEHDDNGSDQDIYDAGLLDDHDSDDDFRFPEEPVYEFEDISSAEDFDDDSSDGGSDGDGQIINDP